MSHRPGRACILHVDLDAFYASVEQVRHPELLGRPVLVGGGVVLAASYEARRYGVSAPMGIREALARCPTAVVVDGSFDDYLQTSKQVFEIVERFSPAVEQISIDEAFVDVCGSERLFGAPQIIADQIRVQVRAETGLAISVGVAPTKFLAKVASRCAKPDGLVVVPPGGEIAFLHPLPVEMVWGVGPKTAGLLHRHGVFQVGELARLPNPTISTWLGPHWGQHLHALAWNLDPRPVTVGRRAASIGAQSALGRGLTDLASLSRVMMNLADRVASRLRAKQRAGRTLSLRIRRPTLQEVSRALSLPAPVASTMALHRVGMELMEAARPDPSEPVTLVGISVSHLDQRGYMQLELPFNAGDPTRAGSPAGLAHLESDHQVDVARERFGREAVGRASVVLHKSMGVPDGFRRLAEHD